MWQRETNHQSVIQYDLVNQLVRSDYERVSRNEEIENYRYQLEGLVHGLLGEGLGAVEGRRRLREHYSTRPLVALLAKPIELKYEHYA